MVTGILSLFVMTSCVDENYDMSKDMDMTIGVGKGLSLPVGSTEKIYLSDLIDTASVDVLEMDQYGNYVIQVGGTVAPTSFKIDDVALECKTASDKKHYDFNLVEVENHDELPDWMKDEIMNGKHSYVVYDDLEYNSSIDISQNNIPKEITRLRSMSFKNPVKLDIKIKLYSANHMSDEMLEITKELHFAGAEGEEGFVIEVPEYIVFGDDTNFKDGKIIIDGALKYDDATKAMYFEKTFEVLGLDFSRTEDGCVKIEDGALNMHEEFRSYGYVMSDTVFFSNKNLTHIQSIDIESNIRIDEMSLNKVVGVFNPQIDPISEVMDLNLGDDMDFFRNAYLDVTDPRIYLTFNNPLDARIVAKANFLGMDGDSNPIESTRINVDVEVLPETNNKIVFKRYDTQEQGWTNYCVPNLNELIKSIPDKVSVNLGVELDTTRYSSITIGEEISVSGSYDVKIPLAFDEFRLEYVHSIEDIFGDDEIFNTIKEIKEINGASLSFNVLNTIPLGLVPRIYPYDKDGVPLSDVRMEIEGNVEKGNGYDGSDNPVQSGVKVILAANAEQLKRLYRIDIKLQGYGNGALNANEYLQLTDISLNIDDYITVDLNR